MAEESNLKLLNKLRRENKNMEFRCDDYRGWHTR